MHRQLKRQLKKAGIDPNSQPSPEQWGVILEKISATYDGYENERYLLERSLQISSEELQNKFEESKAINNHLVQTAKMASLGTLSSEIAHELNNPLQVLSFFSEFLVKTKLTEKQKKHVEKINKAIDKMIRIVKRMKKITHTAESNKFVSTLINFPIKESCELLEKKLQLHDIQLDFDIEEGMYVNCDPYQLESVFQNLLSNSIESFAENEHRLTDERKIHFKASKNGKRVEITYRDNAGGIAQDILEKVFDPFFSTKEVGVGSGMGMAIIKQILKNHQGEISVKSDSTFFSEFKIHLPIFEKHFSDATENKSVYSTSSKNVYQGYDSRNTKTLKILVVDDEADILEAIEGVLSVDFKPTCCISPLDAKKKLETEHFDLILTDLRMPEYDGVRFISDIRNELNITEPIILMSGHADFDPDLKRAMEKGANLFISKPFSSNQELVHQICKLMHETPNEEAA